LLNVCFRGNYAQLVCSVFDLLFTGAVSAISAKTQRRLAMRL
jgi:hypothetical protein